MSAIYCTTAACSHMSRATWPASVTTVSLSMTAGTRRYRIPRETRRAEPRLALAPAGRPDTVAEQAPPNSGTIMTELMDDRHSAAELLVQCLENEGVTVVFGLPGEENIHLTQALDRSRIRYVLTRHEQAASFMAEMYGRITGSAGVVSSTLGPGAINMQLGVADAMTNSTPLVALSAQVGHDRNFKE